MNVKPKVLFVGPRPRPGVVGGVATMTGRIINSSYLNEAFDLHFVDLEEIKLSFKFPFRVLNGVTRRLFKWNIAENILLNRRAAFATETIDHIRPDIIMCFFSNRHFFWLMGRVVDIARNNNIPFIADYRAEGFAAFLKRMPRRKQDETIAILRRVDALVVRNEPAVEWFRAFLPNTRIVRLFNPANALFMRPQSDSPLDNNPTRTADIQIAFVGVSSPHNKGAFLLLSALKLIVQSGIVARLVMAGPDKIGFADHVGKLNASIRNLIQLRGALSPAEICALYHESDLFVIPSYSECFPNALIEAMSCGLACIGTRVGAIPEILDHGNCGLLIDVGDHEQLATGLLQLMRDGALREKLGRAAKKRAQTEYSMSSFEKEIEKVLRDSL